MILFRSSRLFVLKIFVSIGQGREGIGLNDKKLKRRIENIAIGNNKQIATVSGFWV
jgi:hypothetical protein